MVQNHGALPGARGRHCGQTRARPSCSGPPPLMPMAVSPSHGYALPGHPPPDSPSPSPPHIALCSNTWETPSLKTSVSPRLAPIPRGKKCTHGYVSDTFKDEKTEAPGTAFLKIAWRGGVVVKDGAWATTRSLKPHKVLFYQEASPDTVFQCIRTQGQSEKPDGPPPTPPPPPS